MLLDCLAVSGCCMCEYCLSAGVGCLSERYRELIEAADTITEMKRSSDSVCFSLCL